MCECGLVQEMQAEVNGLQSQLDYMLDVVDKCRSNKMAGRMSASLADSVTATAERHGKLQTDIGDTLSEIERAQNNIDDFEVRNDISDKSLMTAVLSCTPCLEKRCHFIFACNSAKC